MPLAQLASLPRPMRWALIGAVVSAAVGGILGLVIGLVVYPPTAFFALFEVAIPAAMLGGIVGLTTGAIVSAVGSLGRLGTH